MAIRYLLFRTWTTPFKFDRRGSIRNATAWVGRGVGYLDARTLARTARPLLQPPRYSFIHYGRCTSCGARANVEFVRKWPLTCAFLDSDPLVPGPARVPQHRKAQEEGMSIPSFCVVMLAQEPSLDSTQIAESQGSLLQLRVEVTGMYLNPNSLMP